MFSLIATTRYGKYSPRKSSSRGRSRSPKASSMVLPDVTASKIQNAVNMPNVQKFGCEVTELNKTRYNPIVKDFTFHQNYGYRRALSNRGARQKKWERHINARMSRAGSACSDQTVKSTKDTDREEVKTETQENQTPNISQVDVNAMLADDDDQGAAASYTPAKEIFKKMEITKFADLRRPVMVHDEFTQ